MICVPSDQIVAMPEGVTYSADIKSGNVVRFAKARLDIQNEIWFVNSECARNG